MMTFLSITGQTCEGRPVVGGVGTVCFEQGVPLELVLHVFQKNNFWVDWLDYITKAIKDGHKVTTIRSRIAAAVGDVYGENVRTAIMSRIDRFLQPAS